MKIEYTTKTILVKSTKGVHLVIHMGGEVFIWRDDEEYAVPLNMFYEVPQDEVTSKLLGEFHQRYYEQAERIEANWKLVGDIYNDYEGKVLGQRKV